MTTLAILPIKSFADAKTRLAEELTPGPRRALAEAMFSDVLVALRRARGVDEVLVISNDHGAQQIAGGYGARVLDDTDRSHNAAAEQGIRDALEHGFNQALLVPGDCPLLDPGEIDRLIARGAGPRPSVVIVPDRHGTGTNALLLSPPNAMTPTFGAGSRQRHAAAAESAGLDHEVLEVSSLSLDIDTPEDLTELSERLAASRGGAAHTRGMLSQLHRSRG